MKPSEKKFMRERYEKFEFVKGGIYKIVMTNGQRFTGYFRSTRDNPWGRTHSFNIGANINPGKEGPMLLLLADGDIKKATRMSPRHVDTVTTKDGREKYVAMFKYGED